MNYLAHARHLTDRPFALVGAALPDWLRALDPRLRLTPDSPGLPPIRDGIDAEIREGIRIHHEDNLWFHRTEAFREESAAIAAEIRAVHPDRPDRRMRASFFAHVLLEMLLDGALLEADPGFGDAYYAALDAADPAETARRVRAYAPAADGDVDGLLGVYRTSRFLIGYVDDDALVARLDRVGRRMRQPPLPDGFREVVARARPGVRARAGELLTPPDADVTRPRPRTRP